MLAGGLQSPGRKGVMPSQYTPMLELALQRAIDGKGGLATSIAETCLTPSAGLNETELSLTFDIVRILIDTVETCVRRHLAGYLAERNDVPQDLLTFLANDDISVAYPILVHSRMLHDDELINVVAKRTKQHRLAISTRPIVSEPVCDAIIQNREPEVIESLLFNGGASINTATLDAIVTESSTLDAYQLPLVHRMDLSPDQARRLYNWVGDSLREHITSHFKIELETAEEATKSAISQALHDGNITTGDAASRTAALRAALRQKDRHAVEVGFAACTELDPASVIKVLYGRSLRALAVACKASDLSVTMFGDLLSHTRGGKKYGGYEQNSKFTRGVAFFEKLDPSLAQQVLEKWRYTPSSIWRDDRN